MFAVVSSLQSRKILLPKVVLILGVSSNFLEEQRENLSEERLLVLLHISPGLKIFVVMFKMNLHTELDYHS